MRSLLLRLYGVFTTVVQPLVRRKLRRRAVAEPGYGVAVEERFGYYDDATTGEATRLHHNNTVRTIAPEYEWVASPDGSKLYVGVGSLGNIGTTVSIIPAVAGG